MTTNTAVSLDQGEQRFQSFKPDMTASDANKKWAAEKLEPLPTRLIFVDPAKNKVEVFEDSDGMVWRRAFALVADSDVKGEFRVYLFAGATVHDLDRAEGLIAKAKAGVFSSDMWSRRDEPNNWVFRKWFEFREQDEGERCLVECTIDVCVDAYHSQHPEDGPGHRMESIEDAEGHYTAHAHIFDQEIGWQTWVDFSPELPDGRPGMEVLRRALNDLEWLQAECDKLNTAGGVA